MLAVPQLLPGEYNDIFKLQETKIQCSYFPQKQIAPGVGEYFTDGGLKFNYAGKLALDEARHLFPNSAEPTFFTASCGKYRVSQGQSGDSRRLSFNVLLDSHMEDLSADMQYQQHLRFEQYHSSSVVMNRLDLDMEMERPALHAVDILPQICRNVDSSLASNSEFYESQLKPAAFRWIASLFCFEFSQWPTVSESRLRCSGHIFCRYPDKHRLAIQLEERFGKTGGFIIGDNEWIDFKLPVEVEFQVSSIEEPFNIRFRCDDQETSISGLPNTVSRVLALQQDWHRGQERSWRKRTKDDGQICQASKRMKHNVGGETVQLEAHLEAMLQQIRSCSPAAGQQ